VKDGHRHFVIEKGKRGKLIMPCGSGKSLTAYWIAGKLNARRIVIAVPSLALIRQTLKVWLRETMANHQAVEWICVCSDESAGRIERDDVAVLRQDLGVPCLTAPGEIAAWLKRKHRGLTVVFTTYQSGEALSKAARAAKFRFDLGVMDEAHKTVGDGSKLFSHLLHDKNLPVARRIFMTATERRYAGKGDTVLSMDDPAIYGETFHLLSFKRALEYKPPILSDYKIISISVSREEVAELIRSNIFVRPDKGAWSKEVEADMLASLIALRKAMTKHPIRHAVSFHSSIHRAELFKSHNDAFSGTFPELGKLETFHVSGKTPTGTRARSIGDFARTKRALITNARCLTEGVDVPGIDCVLFADQRRSAVDIVQAVGRALRPAPGKKLGYVIVPILHDADASPDDIFDSDSFQEILTTLRALAANDDRIIEYFRTVSQGRQRTGGGSVEFDLDERIAKKIDLSQFVQDIELKCWDRLAKLAWRPFHDARQFARTLCLKGSSDWYKYSRNLMPEKGSPPSDIPTAVDRVYEHQGWCSWGDWLGTGEIASQLKRYQEFTTARSFVRNLGLRNRVEWRLYCSGNLLQKGSLPEDVPSAPWIVYSRKGWRGLGDWLGTGNEAAHLRKFRNFRKARSFARKLRLQSQSEWFSFARGKLPHKGRLPSDIPANPHVVYENDGWIGCGDWLGTGNIAAHLRKYRNFVKARRFAHTLGLHGQSEWRRYCKGEARKKRLLPLDIPANPHVVYTNSGWAGFGDWLNTRNLSNKYRVFDPFKKARLFARSLKLRTLKEWQQFTKGDLPQKGRLPTNIPSTPSRTYADKGWISIGDWLGTETVTAQLRQYRTFKKARAFARGLCLRNTSEWRAFCKGNLHEKGTLPADILANPQRTYVDQGWDGYGDWLGTGRTRRKKRT